jgi:hypothetical protein
MPDPTVNAWKRLPTPKLLTEGRDTEPYSSGRDHRPTEAAGGPLPQVVGGSASWGSTSARFL